MNRGSSARTINQRRAESIDQRWRDEVGIDDSKLFDDCTRGFGGCLCENDALDTHYRELVERVQLQLTQNESTTLRLPTCCAATLLTRVFAAMPRTVVVYVHLGDDMPCKDENCTRAHSFLFSSSLAPSSLTATTPRRKLSSSSSSAGSSLPFTMN
jgi:hypothetical protein